MRNIFGMMLLLAGASSFAFAGGVPKAPEIDAVSAGGALALLAGGLLIIRARRK
jgi:hypothetical protein